MMISGKSKCCGLSVLVSEITNRHWNDVCVVVLNEFICSFMDVFINVYEKHSMHMYFYCNNQCLRLPHVNNVHQLSFRTYKILCSWNTFIYFNLLAQY